MVPPSIANRKICLHNCHREYGVEARVPLPMRHVHIFLNESNGLKRERALHTCIPPNSCCEGPEYRSLTPADWVKFAGALFEATQAKNQRAADIIEQYQQCWGKIHNSEPPLDRKKGPFNWLEDPTVLPSPDIPWFAYPQPSGPLLPNALGDLLNKYHPRYTFEGPYPRLADVNYKTAPYFENPARARKLRMICILSNLHSVGLTEGLDAYSNVMFMNLTDYEIVRKVHPKCIMLIENLGNGHCKVLTSTLVLLALESKRAGFGFDVRFMHFLNYHTAIVDRDNQDWHLLTNAHIVIGGVEFSDDYFGHAKHFYEIKPPQMLQHWDGLLELRKQTLLWPDPEDLFQAGSKLHINALAQAVALSENQIYPICLVVDPTVKVAKDIIDHKSNGVLKREWSSSTDYVVYRHSNMENLEEYKANVAWRKKLDKELGKMEKHTLTTYSPQWFIQSYIPSLVYVGELRVFVVNGMILQKIITTPINGDGTQLNLVSPHAITPLNWLRKTISGPFHQPGISPLDGSRINSSVYAVSTDNLVETFILRTLSKFIYAEELVTKRHSGLRIFARVDVTVLRRENNEFQYVVNEVMRGHWTGTWGGTRGVNEILLVQELSQLLHFMAYEFAMQK